MGNSFYLFWRPNRHGCFLFSFSSLSEDSSHNCFSFLRWTLGSLLMKNFDSASARTFLRWSSEELLWVTINFVFPTPISRRLWPFQAFNLSEVCDRFHLPISEHVIFLGSRADFFCWHKVFVYSWAGTASNLPSQISLVLFLPKSGFQSKSPFIYLLEGFPFAALFV